MERVERQDRARLGGKPSDLAIFHRHGKDAEPIGFQQEVGIDHWDLCMVMIRNGEICHAPHFLAKRQRPHNISR